MMRGSTHLVETDVTSDKDVAALFEVRLLARHTEVRLTCTFQPTNRVQFGDLAG